MKIIKKFLFILLFCVPLVTFGQNRNYKFISDYQIDKTYNGSKKQGREKVLIVVSDPKLMTPKDAELENSPRGAFVFKFDGVSPIKQDVVFMGSNSQGHDIYAITHTDTDHDIIYIMKGSNKFGSKTYMYTVLLGKTDINNMGGLPKYYTAFYCNLTK